LSLMIASLSPKSAAPERGYSESRAWPNPVMGENDV
jgi:hypothetical protein